MAISDRLKIGYFHPTLNGDSHPTLTVYVRFFIILAKKTETKKLCISAEWKEVYKKRLRIR